MKQIESEKEVLLEGLQAVERAREWYRKQIAIVQDKMKYICRMGSHVSSLNLISIQGSLYVIYFFLSRINIVKLSKKESSC